MLACGWRFSVIHLNLFHLVLYFSIQSNSALSSHTWFGLSSSLFHTHHLKTVSLHLPPSLSFYSLIFIYLILQDLEVSFWRRWSGLGDGGQSLAGRQDIDLYFLLPSAPSHLTTCKTGTSASIPLPTSIPLDSLLWIDDD